MENSSIIVIDDFYEDPCSVREQALKLNFSRASGTTYPGRQANSHQDWMWVWKKLRQRIHEQVDAPSPKPIPTPQGMFRLALATDEALRLDGVHQDVQRWAGVIYLSRSCDCKGGVAFFKHKETGLTASSRDLEYLLFGHLTAKNPDEVQTEVLAYLRDMKNWEQIDMIPMKYNRAVLLMAQCFHMSVGCFGDKPENGRLTQHFEFFSPSDSMIYDVDQI